MIAFAPGTKVWIAGGVTDMRCGMNSLALKIQEGLGRDPQMGSACRSTPSGSRLGSSSGR